MKALILAVAIIVRTNIWVTYRRPIPGRVMLIWDGQLNRFVPWVC